MPQVCIESLTGLTTSITSQDEQELLICYSRKPSAIAGGATAFALISASGNAGIEAF